MALESGERVVVGVNRYREGEEPEPAFFAVDPELAGGQLARLAASARSATTTPSTRRLPALRADCAQPT